MNLKHFYNHTSYLLTVTIVVTSTTSDLPNDQSAEVTHRFQIPPDKDYKLEYGTLECCVIKAISIGYVASGIHCEVRQEILSGEARLAQTLNEGSYIAITGVSPPALESDA